MVFSFDFSVGGLGQGGTIISCSALDSSSQSTLQVPWGGRVSPTPKPARGAPGVAAGGGGGDGRAAGGLHMGRQQAPAVAVK